MSDKSVRFIVEFADGTYYTGHLTDAPKTTNLNKAHTYSFDWLVYKDFYLLLYLEKEKQKYTIKEVCVKKVVELI